MFNKVYKHLKKNFHDIIVKSTLLAFIVTFPFFYNIIKTLKKLRREKRCFSFAWGNIETFASDILSCKWWVCREQILPWGLLLSIIYTLYQVRWWASMGNIFFPNLRIRMEFKNLRTGLKQGLLIEVLIESGYSVHLQKLQFSRLHDKV